MNTLSIMKCVFLISIFISTSSSAAITAAEKTRLSSYLALTSDDTNFQNPVELTDPSDPSNPVVGYAWRMIRPNTILQDASPQAVLASGFDAQADTEPAVAGTLDSYYQLVKQLTYEYENGAVRGFAEHLVADRNQIVWVIDYIDRRGAVEANSLAVQALLTSQDYLDQQRNDAKSALFGYSMGGLVARHALLSLEDSGFQHNVGAYVSLDAPHRGAFLPPALEVVSRTMLKQTYSGLTTAATKYYLREDLGIAVDIYNSPAAKQLLGIYIGKSVPKYKKYGWLSEDEVYGSWIDLDEYYQELVADNDRARDKSFYELRESLVDMGSYPTLPLNIGVSFGRADGARLDGQSLHAPEDRPNDTGDFKAYAGGVQLADVHFKSINGTHLCKVELAGHASRSCPELPLNNQHLQSVFSAPGSVVSAMGKVIDEIIEKKVSGLTGIKLLGYVAADLILPFGSKGLTSFFVASGVDITGHSNEEEATFIPMVSAFDDKDWALKYPGNTSIGGLQSPFDTTIADETLLAGNPGEHDRIRANVVTQIFNRFTSANIYGRQKNRIGGDNFPGTWNSTYFDTNSGAFDTLRYIVPKSIRELPIVADEDTTDFLSTRTSEDAIVAATIAAM